MDLTPYLDSVAADLDRATALADDQTRDVAHRLTTALEPGLRLALLRAVTDTAAQINTELDDAVVTVAMAGRDPLVAVTRTAPPPHTPPAAPHPPGPAAGPGPEGEAGGQGEAGDQGETGGTARITLRLPEQLKSRAEDLAARAGQSLNTWLVQAVREATEHEGAKTRHTPHTSSSRRIAGWA